MYFLCDKCNESTSRTCNGFLDGRVVRKVFSRKLSVRFLRMSKSFPVKNENSRQREGTECVKTDVVDLAGSCRILSFIPKPIDKCA